jgi:hypothetical protein
MHVSELNLNLGISKNEMTKKSLAQEKVYHWHGKYSNAPTSMLLA